MPGDTSIITHSVDSIQLPDTAFSYEKTLVAPVQHNGEENTVLLVVGLLLLALLISWLHKRYKQIVLHKEAMARAASNFAQYDELLAGQNGYYRSLSGALRHRFVERVVWFMETKTFTCVNLQQEDRMALLISAASIQISFGLDKFLLDFFDTIYILQHNYNYGFYARPFEGHVNSNGIYLSWDNFLKGFEDYSDADNVGLHEMAHALAYVNFMAGANSAQDEAFIQRFYDFSAVARPIFNDMQNGKTNLLNDYAATNYNEFWAVAVETFFEQSSRMKANMPGLYNSMCQLLNQDPLTPERLLTIPGTLT